MKTENRYIMMILPLILRVGLGLVFLIGGLSKLNQLLDPTLQEKILTSYWGTSGYVNQFFIDFMFSPDQLSPWWFLTSLSFFELFSGIALIVGFAVRPLSLIYAFLLWAFVIALPTITVPFIEVTVKTYTAPAIFVQIRDIALSGMMFILYNLGSGAYSLDKILFHAPANNPNINWDSLGLLLRLSLAIPIGIGAVFFGMANIQTFASNPWILLLLAILITGGVGLRYAGIAIVFVMLWYMVYKFNIDKSLIGNLNGFKREFAFIAAGIVLSIAGGGQSHTITSAIKKIQRFLKNSTTS